MPNRILKESICSSDSINELSWFEETMFYRLIVNCDDYGRMDARPAMLKAKLFPLKDRISHKDIESALVKLADAGCVIMYVCDNKPYLYLPTWEVHQSIRAKKSKYPDPKACEINCMQMQADDCKCSRNPIQSESNPIRNPNPNTRGVGDVVQSRFDEFWSVYPKKVGKQAAFNAFKKIKPDGDLHQRMLNAIAKAKDCEQWCKNNGQYIPNPATWLNQGRWDDELGGNDGQNTGHHQTSFSGRQLGSNI